VGSAEGKHSQTQKEQLHSRAAKLSAPPQLILKVIVAGCVSWIPPGLGANSDSGAISSG
jgi:hypothetical protein